MRAILLSVVFCIYLTLITIHPASAEITLDGSLGPAQSLTGPGYIIEAEDGKLVNQTNLFHSFGIFNLDSNESATFNGPDTVNNIIGRITGGTLSSIDGLISSTIPDANLFLLNPAGFLFGPNASLDVSGSFHASTADYLRLGEDGLFYADPEQNSILTVASPVAFGFLDGNPADISIQESTLEVTEGKTLSLVGGNINVTGNENSWKNLLIAPGGKINLAAVSSAGEVIINTPDATPDLTMSGFEELGQITISSSGVQTGGNGGGTIDIRGGRLLIDDSSLYASATGPANNEETGSGIDIQITTDVVLNNHSQIGTNIFSGVSDDSGGVRIAADRLELTNYSEIQSVAYGASSNYPASSGNGGDIRLTTNSILLGDSSMIRTGTGGYGNGGDIIVNTGTLEVKDRGVFFSPVFGGTGMGGNIEISAEHIVMTNDKYPGQVTGINARTYYPGTGKGSDITIDTTTLEMNPGTEISSGTWYLGQGGDIRVNVADQACLEGTREQTPGGEPIYTGIFTNTFWSADGGHLEFSAANLNMTDEAGFQVSTFSTGNAGTATIVTDTLRLTDGAYIATNGYFGTGGNSGNMELISNDIYISGPESSNDPFGADFTGISTASSSQGGLGGDIHILTGNLTLTNRGSITAISWGPDPSGDIKIDADDLQVLNGSNINAGAFGSGNGGSVDIKAESVLISGVHPEVFIENITGENTLSPSAICSQALQNGGNGGMVIIEADELKLLDGGRVTTETSGVGNAGDIQVEAEKVLISGINTELQNFMAEAGGNPKYAAALIYSGTNDSLLGDQATGNGGDIEFIAGSLEMRDRGLISSETITPGTAGNISISTQNIEMLSNSSISAESLWEGNAGNIALTAADSMRMDHAAITTEAGTEADGGNIDISVTNLLSLYFSEITSSVGGGPETTGGNITIDPIFVVLNNSQIVANAYEGSGGNINIVAETFLADSNSMIDASSQLGVSGTVNIQAPITSISGLVSPLSTEFVNASQLLRGQCLARIRADSGYSSFLVSGRDGLPIAPGQLLPATLF